MPCFSSFEGEVSGRPAGAGIDRILRGLAAVSDGQDFDWPARATAVAIAFTSGMDTVALVASYLIQNKAQKPRRHALARRLNWPWP
jgi:hypothetical protein